MAFGDSFGGNDFGMAKMFPWPGGKHNVVKKLLVILPPHEIYCEPFAGGASLFFEKADKMPAKKSILGDTDKRVIDFFKGAARGDLRKCKNLEDVPRRVVVEKAKKIYKKNPNLKNLTACEFLILQKGTYSGIASSGRVSFPKNVMQRKVAKTVMKNLPKYEAILKKAKFQRAGFGTIMRRHDSRKTLHYLDPPYHKINDLYAKEGVTPEQIKAVMDKMKGKVILSYNIHPEVERVFCSRGKGKKKYHCYSLTMRYTMAKYRDNGRGRKELIITNFPLKKKKRGR